MLVFHKKGIIWDVLYVLFFVFFSQSLFYFFDCRSWFGVDARKPLLLSWLSPAVSPSLQIQISQGTFETMSTARTGQSGPMKCPENKQKNLPVPWNEEQVYPWKTIDFRGRLLLVWGRVSDFCSFQVNSDHFTLMIPVRKLCHYTSPFQFINLTGKNSNAQRDHRNWNYDL